MASTLCRVGSNAIRRAIFYSSVRASSVKSSKDRLAEASKTITDQEIKAKDDFKTKYGTMTDMTEDLTGFEKEEYLNHMMGNPDPYDMQVQSLKEQEGTLEDPTIVPSLESSRMIGCLCDEDAIGIKWMTLYAGEPRRCDCGKWFKLVNLPGVSNAVH